MTLTLDPPTTDLLVLDEPVDDGTRREFLAGGAALAVLGLAGCGGNGGNGGNGATDEATRMVRHAAGVTQVPVQPSRVATISEVIVAHLASVGLLVVGANDDGLNWVEPYATLLADDLDPGSIEPLGTAEEPNLEALAALRPEMILSESFSMRRSSSACADSPTTPPSRSCALRRRLVSHRRHRRLRGQRRRRGGPGRR